MRLDDNVGGYYPQLSGKILSWFGAGDDDNLSVDDYEYWSSLEFVGRRLGLIGKVINCCFNDLFDGCDALDDWVVIPDYNDDVVWRIGCGMYGVCVELAGSGWSGRRIEIFIQSSHDDDEIHHHRAFMVRFIEADFDEIIVRSAWPRIVDICKRISDYGPTRVGFSI